MENELRRQKSNLFLAGLATIAFGVWSAVKAVMNVGLNKEFHDMVRQVSELNEITSTSLYATVFAAMAFAFAVEIGYRLYVGLSAVAESRGKKKSNAYVIFTVIMIIVNIVVYVDGMVQGMFEQETFFSSFMNLIIEISSLYIMTELAVSAIKLKRLQRRREGD